MTRRLAILGGCGGIGRALVAAAAKQGYQPVVLDLAASIAAHPLDGIDCRPVDATDPASLAAAADGLGDLAGFVNLCGFAGSLKPLPDTDETALREVIDGNLFAAIHAARAFAGRLAPGAAIVNTGSGLGHYARPGFGPYAISKAGIAALTRQLALELAPRNRVNCVSPSAVDTAFLQGGTGRSEAGVAQGLDFDAYAKAIPLGRIAVPADVVGPVLFLLSDAAGYMTGQVLHVNGGGYMP